MWRSPPSLAGPPVPPGLPLQARPLQSLAGMVGASWDLQAEGYRRGEGTDLVPPLGYYPMVIGTRSDPFRAGPKAHHLYPVTCSNCASMYGRYPSGSLFLIDFHSEWWSIRKLKNLAFSAGHLEVGSFL